MQLKISKSDSYPKIWLTYPKICMQTIDYYPNSEK